MDHILEPLFYEYGNPPEEIVEYLDRGNGVPLAYLGHAHVTRILDEIDSTWTWEPLEIVDGRPAINYHKGIQKTRVGDTEVDMATMWGRLTLRGITRIAVGSVSANKPDLDKELVSDFLRNAAMRFGIGLGLWMKHGEPSQSLPDARFTARPSVGAQPATEAQERALYAMSKKLDLLPPAKGSLTKQEAGKKIEALDALLKAAETSGTFDDEEAF